MSSTRLPFLYPPSLRSPATTTAARSFLRSASVRGASSFTTTARRTSTTCQEEARRREVATGKRWKGSFAPRHGKAIEPSSLTSIQQKQLEEAQRKQGPPKTNAERDRALEEEEEEEEEEGDPEGEEESELVTAQESTGDAGDGAQLASGETESTPLPLSQTAVAAAGDGREARPQQAVAPLPETEGEEAAAEQEAAETLLEQKAAQAAAGGDTLAQPQDSSTSTAKGNAKPGSSTVGGNHEESTTTASSTSAGDTSTPAGSSFATAADAKPQDGGAAKPGGPLEAIMHMPPPENHREKQHPSMTPPPYVHHFDSYSLVKQLQEGGYTDGQAITFMKGIRSLLAENLDVAQESLVSKSDVENETYLFRAACSELGTEIKNNRRLQDEQMRQQRTHLQHEVDILTQTLNQELLTVNDTVRGLFNDRKMTVREEQKAVDSAIQQINYKMSIMLSSDSKSEIEGVRWVLIRRSVLGIIFMAMVTLATLRYASYLGQERQREEERQRQREEELKRDGGKRDNTTAADAAVLLVEGG